MNLAIEPAVRLYEVSVVMVSGPSRHAARRVLKVLADTPKGAVRIARERYPQSKFHAVLSQAALPEPAWA